ncbi:beta-ketoacyl synthase N-terminal-like domain-containing protein [Spirillospora sp. CA-294931]|uniref:beta-ketoacyl synthase N-terminal-like domain-containing protein n=1 Tax=Spirillospora sp. CA-294931 TaxID=3240042 RepID=UPI003D91CD0A
MSRAPVVTGIGIAAPNGLGAERYWAATRAGVSGIGPVARFDAAQYPSRLAGEVAGFDAAEHLPSRLLPQTDHMTRLALVAAGEALDDAAVEPGGDAALDRGVVTAASAGGFEFGQRELEMLWSRGGEYVSAYQSFAWFYAVNTGQISIRHGLKGPGGVLVTDQAGGLDAIAEARRQLRRRSRLIVCGGVDGSICPWGRTAQLTSGRLGTGDDPATAYLPFDERAAGHVPAEGGAILVLEDPEDARERGAPRVYGEIAGYAATFDPRPGGGRGSTLRRAIEGALADAGTRPGEIDVVFADAAATPALDRAETEAIAAVFGDRAVPVTAPKTMLGRMYAGTAALDVATALLAIRDGVIPPTVNVRPAHHHPIEVVTGGPRRAPLRAAVVIARGQGGFNSALVVRAAGPASPDGRGAHSRWEERIMPDRPLELDELSTIFRESAGVDHAVDFDGAAIDTEFDELGIDSIALMETASRISREHGVRLDEEELAGATTARLLLDLVNERKR